MSARARAWEENVARAAKWLEVAVAAGAQVVLLPELFAIGSFYAPDLLSFAEPPLGRTALWLQRAAQHHQIIIGGTILEQEEAHFYNALLLAEPSGRVLHYRKQQLGLLEARCLSPGHEPNVLTTSVGLVGCLICSDGNSVALRRRLAVARVDLLLVPQAIGATAQLGRFVEEKEKNGRDALWGPIVREVGAPAVTAGLVGFFENPIPEEAGDYLRGGTYVIDAAGHGLAHVAFPEEGLAVATIPFKQRID